MAINKGTLAKEINGAIEYIYPKTSSDMVEYSSGISIKSKIDTQTTNISNLESRINNLVLNASSDTTNNAELIDIRKSAFSTKIYNLASIAISSQLTKIAPIKFRISYLFNYNDSIGKYIYDKDSSVGYTGIQLNKISGSTLTIKYYNKANDTLLLTKIINLSKDYSKFCKTFYNYHVYLTPTEFDLFKNITIYPVFIYTPGNEDPVITVNGNDTNVAIYHTQNSFESIFDYSGISTI